MNMANTKPPVLLVGNFLQSQLRAFGVCEELASRLSESGWSILTTSTRSNKLLRMSDMVNTAWKRRGEYAIAQVDVYSGAAFVWAEAVCLALRRAGKPYALTLRGGNLPAFSARWPGRVRRLLQSADVVVTPSRYLHEQMKPYRDDLLLLPNPLDLSAYKFRLRQRARPRLVWLRALHEIYNPVMAVKVLSMVSKDFPEARLSMVGPDKKDGSLQAVQKAAAELGVKKQLSLPGGVPKSDVPTWMDKGDIFLNTTNIDNTPVSVMEAMACGLCVVSTKVGGIPYLLEHERDALLVPPNDPAAMAKAVRRILTEPGLAERLSCNARLKAQQFDWASILPQWESLFISLTPGGRYIERITR